MMRAIFRLNCKYASSVVVQSDVMKDHLARSYANLHGRIHNIPQPPPSWALDLKLKDLPPLTQPLKLFYPAAGYPHKNHDLLRDMAACADSATFIDEFRICTTLDNTNQQPDFPAFVENLGHLNVADVQTTYKTSHALFFPSFLESFGLPLAEAVTINLPVVCADLPYARWLCEDQAVYFDPEQPEDAVRAIRELKQRLSSGWRPDYSKTREKLPDSWHAVAEAFLKLLYAA
jgi:hypothetical protein